MVLAGTEMQKLNQLNKKLLGPKVFQKYFLPETVKQNRTIQLSCYNCINVYSFLDFRIFTFKRVETPRHPIFEKETLKLMLDHNNG